MNLAESKDFHSGSCIVAAHIVKRCLITVMHPNMYCCTVALHVQCNRSRHYTPPSILLHLPHLLPPASPQLASRRAVLMRPGCRFTVGLLFTGLAGTTGGKVGARRGPEGPGTQGQKQAGGPQRRDKAEKTHMKGSS